MVRCGLCGIEGHKRNNSRFHPPVTSVCVPLYSTVYAGVSAPSVGFFADYNTLTSSAGHAVNSYAGYTGTSATSFGYFAGFPAHLTYSPEIFSIRRALPPVNNIWQFRDDCDAYSGYSRWNIVSPERDHVFEVQLGDAVYEHFQRTRTGVTTRQEARLVQELFNSVENCNITSMAINRSKKGPFQCVKNSFIRNGFRSNGVEGADYYVYCKNKYHFTHTQWENIKHEVVKSYDRIDSNLNYAIHYETDLLIFQGALNDMFCALNLED